jgi:hypothetical protein
LFEEQQRETVFNKGLCNPSSNSFFKFSFYFGSLFLCLFFVEQERNGFILFETRVLDKRYAPKGLNDQRFMQPIIQLFFQVFFLFWNILFLSLFFDEQERNGSLLKNKGFEQRIL